MSSPLKLILISGFGLLLSGCGFQPMYGDASLQATHTPLQGNLAIDTMKGREGQILKAALEDIFNPEGIKFARPDYHLQISLTKNLVASVVKPDGTIQRYDVRYDSSFNLYQTGNPKPLLSGKLRRVGSYDVTTTAEFSTFMADRDTAERTLKEMAEDYMLRLSGYFAGKS
jgi:LPS-assembly lipoprotein